MRQLEASLERAVVKEARARGCLVYKIHERGAPDRLFLTPDGRVFYVEFKRRGEKPRPEQEHEHARLRARGFPVFVVDSRERAIEVLDHELYGAPLD